MIAHSTHANQTHTSDAADAHAHAADQAAAKAGCPYHKAMLAARRNHPNATNQPAEPPPPDPLALRIAERLQTEPNAMTMMLARELGVSELHVIQRLPHNRSARLCADHLEHILRDLEPLGPVHVIVSNAGVTVEVFGQFGNFSRTGPWLNVQSRTLDMHINTNQIAHAYAVTKPSHMDGRETLSIQFYDPRGTAVFKVFLTFGGTEPPPEKRAAFGQLVHTYRDQTPPAPESA